MRAGTWEALGARGIAERDPSTWARSDCQTWIAVKPTCSGLDAVGPDDSPAVRLLLDELLGPTRSSGRDWGKTLVALPERDSVWSVPGTAWHFDHLYRSPGVVTAVNLFLLIDDVAPRGGGTAVVRNSPQLWTDCSAAGHSSPRSANRTGASSRRPNGHAASRRPHRPAPPSGPLATRPRPSSRESRCGSMSCAARPVTCSSVTQRSFTPSP